MTNYTYSRSVLAAIYKRSKIDSLKTRLVHDMNDPVIASIASRITLEADEEPILVVDISASHWLLITTKMSYYEDRNISYRIRHMDILNVDNDELEGMKQSLDYKMKITVIFLITTCGTFNINVEPGSPYGVVLGIYDFIGRKNKLLKELGQSPV